MLDFTPSSSSHTQQNIFDKQFIEFGKVLQNPSLLKLDEYINSFPNKSLAIQIQSNIPIFFHRQWVRASLKGHLRTIKKLRRHTMNDQELDVTSLSLAESWLGQAMKIYNHIQFFKSLTHDDLQKYLITNENLEPGDVVVSYKTKSYLKKHRLSWLVKFTTNSPITHTMLVSHSPEGEAEFLVSGDATRGIGLIPAKTVSGEILLILKPEESIRPLIKSEIAKWRTIAIQNDANKHYPFPELKCQTASGLGLITVIFGFLGQPLSLRNPFAKRPGVFCSELIDELFHQFDLLLTPRSINRATVGPIEIFYSRHLSLRGVYCHHTDTPKLHEEISSQFIGR